jgi:hypothetical protein
MAKNSATALSQLIQRGRFLADLFGLQERITLSSQCLDDKLQMNAMVL